MEQTIDYTTPIVHFIEQLGIKVAIGTVPDDSFLPGILIDNGHLRYDPSKILSPGDLLHEAGHIALTPAERRATLHDNIAESDPEGQGYELGVILWSYAALLDVGIPIEVVFHEEGYKGQAEWLRTSLSEGTYIGLPLLEWMQMGYGHAKASELGVEPFPKMLKWLRD